MSDRWDPGIERRWGSRGPPVSDRYIPRYDDDDDDGEGDRGRSSRKRKPSLPKQSDPVDETFELNLPSATLSRLNTTEHSGPTSLAREDSLITPPWQSPEHPDKMRDDRPAEIAFMEKAHLPLLNGKKSKIMGRNDAYLRSPEDQQISRPVSRSSSPPNPRDLIERLSNLADVISRSATLNIQIDQATRELEASKRLAERQHRHQANFATLAEEAQFKFEKAEKASLELQASKHLAQAEQAAAIKELALFTLPNHDASIPTRDEPAVSGVLSAVKSENEFMRQELSDTKSALTEVRQEIRFMSDKIVQHEHFNKTTSKLIAEMITRESHVALEKKLFAASHNFENLFEMGKKEAQAAAAKYELKLAEFDESLGTVKLDTKRIDEGLVTLANAKRAARSDKDEIEGLHTMLKEYQKRHLNDLEVMKASVKQLESKVEISHSALPSGEVIRDSNDSFKIFEAALQESVTALNEQYEADKTAFADALQEQETSLSGIQNVVDKLQAQLLNDLPIGALQEQRFKVASLEASQGSHLERSQNQDLAIQKLEQQMSGTAHTMAKVEQQETQLRSLMAFLNTQQQKYESLTSTRMAHNIIHYMAQAYPNHPANWQAQINQAVSDGLKPIILQEEGNRSKVAEQISKLSVFLRSQLQMLHTSKDRVMTEVEKIQDSVSSEHQRVDQIQVTNNEVQERQKEVEDLKLSMRTLQKSVNNLTDKLATLENDKNTTSETPDKSIPTSASPTCMKSALATSEAESISIAPTSSRSDNRVDKASDRQISSQGKRKRAEATSEDFSDAATSLVNTIRSKSIKRRNYSKGA